MNGEEIKTLKSAVNGLQEENLRLLQKIHILQAQIEANFQLVKRFQEQKREYKKCIEEMEGVFEQKIAEILKLKQQVTELKAEIYDLERKRR